MESHKIHVPNHQPVLVLYCHIILYIYIIYIIFSWDFPHTIFITKPFRYGSNGSSPTCIAAIEVALQLGETPWRRAANVLFWHRGGLLAMITMVV